jgi:hypothetical protein
MNNTAIKQTLIELEESLSNIESARNQVNNVTEKSEKIIRSFNDVLKSLESINNILGIDKGEFKNNIDKSFKHLDTDLKKIAEYASSSSNEISKSTETMKSEFIAKLNETTINLKKFEKTLNDTETRISQIDFNSTLESIIKLLDDIKSSLTNNHSEIKNHIESTLTEIEKRLNKKYTQNLILMGIGFVAIILIILLK